MTTRERDWFYATTAVMVVSVLLALWGWQYDPRGDRFPPWVEITILVVFFSNFWVWSGLFAKWRQDNKSTK